MSSLTDSLWEELGQVKVADVVVGVEAPDLQPSYTYAMPERMQADVRIGS